MQKEDKYRERVANNRWLLAQPPCIMDEWGPRLLQLQDFGFKCFSRNLRLMRLLNGDFEKVVDQLIEEDETRRINKSLPKPERIKRQRSENNVDKRRYEIDNKAQNFRDLASFVDLSSWPENITHLYVDGNNLFYQTPGLRFLSLKKSRKQTTKVISEITESFTQSKKLDTILVFDATNILYSKNLENGSTIAIKSAQPTFQTSDEALIHWTKQNPEKNPSTLIITSDRALAGELSLSGVKIASSGSWMKFVHRFLTGRDGDPSPWVDAWVENFISRNNI